MLFRQLGTLTLSQVLTKEADHIVKENLYFGKASATEIGQRLEQDTTTLTAGGLWGALWVFYAYMYGRYFGHVAARTKPAVEYTDLPGSQERLRNKRTWSYRFSVFMLMPTLLETIRSSWFTGSLITLLPCIFGVWVMHAVWREVLRSEIPQSSAAKGPR